MTIRRRMLVVLLGLLVGVGLAVVPSAAFADGLDLCKDAPAPIAPKSGMAGMLTAKPARVPEVAPDPFTDPGVSIGQVYGYNWSWANYDLGCGNDFLRDPLAVANTKSANVGAGITGAGTAMLAGLEHLAKDSQIGWLTNVVTTVAGSLRTLLLGSGSRIGWLPLAVIALAVVVAVKARNADYAATMRTLGVVVVAAGLCVFALLTPAVASRAADGAVTGLASAAGGSFSGSMADSVNRTAGYRTWLAGYFDDPDSPLARQYGPRLLAATHYSWSDIQRIEQHPAARAGIDRSKAKEFKTVASAVEKASASSYEMFVGRGDRTGIATLGIVIMACAGLFACIAFVMILMARLMMQGLVIAAPVAAVLGILPPGYGVIAKMWDLFAAALIAVVKFTLATGAMSLILAGLAAVDGMPGVEKLCWMIIATVVGLVLTRPARTFKTIMPGLDPNRHYLRDLAGKAATVFAISHGVQMALDTTNQPDPTQQPGQAGPSTSEPARAALPASTEQSLPPLPAPEWVQVDQTTTQAEMPVQNDLVRPAVPTRRQWAGILDSHSDTTGSPETTWAVGSESPRRALPAGPTVIEHPSGPASAAEPAGDLGDSAESAGGAHVVYPSGVIIPADPAVYRAGEPDAQDTYVRLPEPEVDELGREHAMVTYSSGREADSHA